MPRGDTLAARRKKLRWFAALCMALATNATGCAASANPDDAKGLVGWWVVTESIVDGEPDTENVGHVYRFDEGNRLRYFTRENLGRQEYRLDFSTTPKTLESFHIREYRSGSGIYELSGDTLRWRTSAESQSLGFSDRPKGRWWDWKLRRITEAEAATTLKALEDARDKLEAEEWE